MRAAQHKCKRWCITQYGHGNVFRVVTVNPPVQLTGSHLTLSFRCRLTHTKPTKQQPFQGMDKVISHFPLNEGPVYYNMKKIKVKETVMTDDILGTNHLPLLDRSHVCRPACVNISMGMR